jgi:hypothetical protein
MQTLLTTPTVDRPHPPEEEHMRLEPTPTRS